MNLRKIRFHSPFASLYAEAAAASRHSAKLLFLLFSNIFGNMHTIICGSGTTSMIQLSNFLGAGDFEYGLITGIHSPRHFYRSPFPVLSTGRRSGKNIFSRSACFPASCGCFSGLSPFLFRQIRIGSGFGQSFSCSVFLPVAVLSSTSAGCPGWPT